MLRVSIVAGTGVKGRVFPLLLGAALCFLSGPPAFAQCTPDAYEEDDACFSSKTIMHGGDTQSHNFCQDAADWINFNACTGRTYTIETSNLGASANTVLELYDTDCSSLITSDDDGGVGSASKIAGWTAPAVGTYHIKVLQFDGTFGDNRGYDITLTGDTSPCSTWARVYGYDNWAEAQSVRQTSDGGFVVAGTSQIIDTFNGDFWVLKLDAFGNITWEKTYGGFFTDWPTSIQQTADGGFIVAGFTASFGASFYDVWVLKLNPDGTIDWEKTYGGASDDRAYSIQQTADDGYVVAGYTQSFGDSDGDVWVLKLNPDGTIEWDKTYGGAYTEEANSIRQTSDYGFIVAGVAESLSEPNGDIWVLKLSDLGAIEWEKTYGGASLDRAYSVQQTSDDWFVVAGQTYSFGTAGDMLVLRLNNLGAIQWQETYGGPDSELANSIQQTTDGGYVVAGYTDMGPGGSAWVLKLSDLGAIQWQKIYSGFSWEEARSIRQTTDGGYVVAGSTDSFSVTADPTCFCGLCTTCPNFWVLKLDASGGIAPSCTLLADTTEVDGDPTATETGTTAAVGAAVITPDGNHAVTVDDTAATVGPKCAPYLIYDSHAVTDCGNADGVVDPGETIDLSVTVQNAGDADAFEASGVLSTTTPGIVLTVNGASFPNISAGSTGTPPTPFRFIVDVGVPCGTFIDFTLDLSYEDSFEGPFSGPTAFQVLVGSVGAPSTLLSENFNSGLPGSWTVVDGLEPGTWWDTFTVGDPCARNSFPDPYMLVDNGCTGTDMDEQLITPLMDASGMIVVTLRFDHEYIAGTDLANVDVRSSKTGGTWVNLAQYMGDIISPAATEVLDITAQAAGASNVEVRWHYEADGLAMYWSVDNVVVEGSPAVCNPACCGLPYVAYDTGFTPTLLEACGDGDLFVEPGEEWQVTVQLHNFGCVTANNTVADLTVNVGSVVSAAVCSNPGTYGNIPAGGAKQFTYSFAVDSLAVCVNDVTFDVTGIASDEGAYPSQVPAFTVQVGQATGGGNEVGTQFTDPLNATGTWAESDFAPDFTLAAPVADAELWYVLSYVPIPGGNEVGTTGAKAKAKGAIAEEPFAPDFTLTKSAASAVISYTLTHQKGEPDLTNCTATWIVRPDATTCPVKLLGAGDPQPVDLPACYTVPGTYSIRLEENCGNGNAEIAAGATFDVTEVDTGNATDNVQIELIGPSGTDVVKNYGAADPVKPIDVTAYYTGPGTYRIRLSEDAGGTATLTGGVLDVTEPTGVECDPGACACSGPPLEPSAVGSPDALLVPATNQIIVENVSNETGYVVYENAIGTWYGTPSQGCLWEGAGVVDLGATVQLNYSLGAGDRWVVVSAANASGESSCGMDSTDAERNAQPGWPATGPCP
ncbi:MAG: hypothetical protein JSV08_02685 [Acidobacteriota bacterium]|nr:MAG: hypothetical protein JSV08_02685 [Acidobacteriota bacterium]